jgi:hypothetical protein
VAAVEGCGGGGGCACPTTEGHDGRLVFPRCWIWIIYFFTTLCRETSLLTTHVCRGAGCGSQQTALCRQIFAERALPNVSPRQR